MFLAAMALSIPPSEFWSMTLPEWFLIVDHHVAKQPIAGTGMTAARHAEIKAWAEKVKKSRQESAADVNP